MNNNNNQALSEFIFNHGGNRVISKVLVANNGIAAVKAIRSIRQWAYENLGNERAIHFTVMATPEDLQANAEYIKMADQYIEVPGGSNNFNYANVQLIVEIAERTEVDAVWAGWGHASENPRLPECLGKSRRSIVFIGPTPSAMRKLGDKISSTIVAQSANVPTISWSGDGVTLDSVDPLSVQTAGTACEIPVAVYRRACVESVTEGEHVSRRIGYPVMIKASEGGGGKGIRKVNDESEFKQAFEQCMREVPGSPIFIMKCIGNCRHLEVQILGDLSGNIISIFGRDCSVQRRHQKIIEEAPITIAPQSIIEKMESSAVRLAKLVGYTGAGTVEYLYDPETMEFFFLELNPRLQVEHPCTEMVSGVNLPAAQLQIAMGIPLNRMKEVQKFTTDSNISVRPKCHVIATRITAENPNRGFKPNLGSMQELNFRSSKHVWGYFSVGASGGLHEFADSQFGHLFAYGESRDQARRNMIVALKELSIRGDFQTTIEYLVMLLETESFKANKISTAWLDDIILDNRLTVERPNLFVAVFCFAVAKAAIRFAALRNEYINGLEKGHVPSKELMSIRHKNEIIYEGVKYKTETFQIGQEMFGVKINSETAVTVHCRSQSDSGFLMSLDSKSFVVYLKDDVDGCRMSLDGKTCIFESENDPTILKTPSSGKLVRFMVDDGAIVKMGQYYAEIEVMKMCLPLTCSLPGILRHLKPEGCTLNAGEVIGRIEPLSIGSLPLSVKEFSGDIPPFGPPVASKSDNPSSALEESIQSISWVMKGFWNPADCQSLINKLISRLRHPQLIRAVFEEKFAPLFGRLPVELERQIIARLESSADRQFPLVDLLHLLKHPSVDIGTARSLIDALEKYTGGQLQFERETLVGILESFYSVEVLFDMIHGHRVKGSTNTAENVIQYLREQNRKDLQYVYEMAFSHANVIQKISLCLEILHHVSRDFVHPESRAVFTPVLTRIASLENQKVLAVSMRSREILLQSHVPSSEERRERILQTLFNNTACSSPASPTSSTLNDHMICDVLIPLLFEKDAQAAATSTMEMYVQSAYQNIGNMQAVNLPSPFVTWQFTASESPLFMNGIMVKANNFMDLSSVFAAVPQLCSADIINIAIDESERQENFDDNDFASRAKDFLAALPLVGLNAHRITFIAAFSSGTYPGFFTFLRKQTSDVLTLYVEDEIIRNIEPTMAHMLELDRLENFRIKLLRNNVQQRRIHIYHATAKQNGDDQRFFIRALVRPKELKESDAKSIKDYLVAEGDRLLSEALDLLENRISASDKNKADCNHIFLNFVPRLSDHQWGDVRDVIPTFINRHGRRLWRLRVLSGEIRICIKLFSIGDPIPLRFFLENTLGDSIRVDIYQEVLCEDGRVLLKSIDRQLFGQAPLEDQQVMFPYAVRDRLQPKRFKAHLLGTTYVYDFPELFREALKDIWKNYALQMKQRGVKVKPPESLLQCTELYLDDRGELARAAGDREKGTSHSYINALSRITGLNTIGMVGWLMDIATPEYVGGRKIVVIANDITHQSGSFGLEEDKLFFCCSELARSLGVPRVYLSANSGARIGLSDDLLNEFKVAWIDGSNPAKGFKYLYITEEQHERLCQQIDRESGDIFKLERIVDSDSGEQRLMIKSLIGSKSGIGVENLRGSGMIAGATAQAYHDIMTVTFVSGRSVGIGAYLVRLGQRAIQAESQPIILTGAAALNKVLGKEVYTSNLQLGGPQIMYSNGVCHLKVLDDLEGIAAILRWLSYVSDTVNSNLIWRPLEAFDSWDRQVEFCPDDKVGYDPRWLIEGRHVDGRWQSGLFDRQSFMETLGGWANTVVTGRARLGGIPIGVIAVETRTVDFVVPADPGDPNSAEKRVQQAGQVWFPNSAFKTAQTIQDLHNGERLPLFILANWRGFSGGMMDMYDQVLKFGSMIVDSLKQYQMPVFVYIPPHAELRGGAWVVVDSSINEEMMEMYADESCRGGILEPDGLVEVKFKRDQIISQMRRLDPRYADLCGILDNAELSQADKSQILVDCETRERELFPVYYQLALHYADLHDRPDRMEAKQVINGVLKWAEARRFFYWRLRRRLVEEHIRAKWSDLGEHLKPRKIGIIQLRKYIVDSLGCAANCSDRQFVDWYEQNEAAVGQLIDMDRRQSILQVLKLY